jgi:serine phosphatase RsbU (regulator of sigma subunit)
MAILITLQGPQPGRHYRCAEDTTVIGRQLDCAVCLESPAVSRQHAQITLVDGQFFIEDLGSSNGTFLNGERLLRRQPLHESDTLQIGPYHLALRRQPSPPSDADPIIRAQVNALSSNHSLYTQNPAHKLRVFVETSQCLGRTLEVRPLLNKLLEQLFRLFPQADRGMVIVCEGDRFVVRAQRIRHRPLLGLGEAAPVEEACEVGEQGGDFPFSRSLVQRALDDGVGLLSEDVSDDDNLPKTATLIALNLRSFLCVPLIGLDKRRLGVIQLDCTRPGKVFRPEDLELLTALGLQVAGVLENAALHEERVREERLLKELAMARDIQQAFLPRDFHPLASPGYELYACVQPARQVSGDLYDFFPDAAGRLALFVGDVSGKGMPAALFMVAVRTLTRHLTGSAESAGEMLRRLNNALVADNPTSLFVTMAHAVFDPHSGETTIATGDHPPPLLRRADGRVEEVEVRAGMMLGYASFDQPPAETRLVLAPGETLLVYSDGLTEAHTGNRRSMFGLDRLKQTFAAATGTLAECARHLLDAVSRHAGPVEQHDDQTVLLLRRLTAEPGA